MATSSGRLIEALLEGQHAVGGRIVRCAAKLAETIGTAPEPKPPTPAVLSAMTRLVWLVNHFVDPYHHRMEEDALLPFAHMRGMAPSRTAWVLEEHEQGRAYFRALTIALRRAQEGNRGAVGEFGRICDAFARLYEAHGKREDDVLFKEIGELLTEEDDALACGLVERLGAPDVTLHFDMIQAMEKDLGIGGA